jgi:hypothetical protein
VSVSRFLKEIGRPVAYYPRLANAIGSVKAAVFLCQLLYWQDKGHNAEGWIYKTQEEIIQETGLTRRKQESARKLLVELGLVEEARKGTHGTLHFRVNLDALDALWSGYTSVNGGNVQRPMAETANDECPNPPNANGATRHTLIKVSENTTETTAEEGDPLQHPAVLAYNSTLKPQPPLSINQCETIAATITDLSLWGEVLTIFKGNGHRSRYAGNAVDRYKNEVLRRSSKPPPASPPKVGNFDRVNACTLCDKDGWRQTGEGRNLVRFKCKHEGLNDEHGHGARSNAGKTAA